MAKRLILIRHAKSSWANPLQSDFERPLNDRGQHDAPVMARRLEKAGIIPDKIISSTAKRAAQTAKHIATGVGYDHEKIDWQEDLYQCVLSVFEELIYTVDDTVETLFIVAHNPTISEFAAQLSGSNEVASMPTCAVVGIEVEGAQWSDLSLAKKKLFLFDTPKKNHE